MKYLDKLRNRPIVEKIGIFGIFIIILWTIMANDVFRTSFKDIGGWYIDWGDLGITMVIQFVILIIVFGGKGN